MQNTHWSRWLGRGALAAASGGLLALVASPAWAHVEVVPDTANRGGDAELSFVVPTESDSASTTRVQVFMPEGHPIASVSVRPHPGWRVKVRTQALSTPLSSDDGQVTRAVSSITWTAESPRQALHPGQYDDFDISVGPLPDVSSVVFKTLQTYSDGTVVRWIDAPAPPGEPAAAHPAPMLTLVPDTAATPGSSGAGGSSGSAGSSWAGGRATLALAVSTVALLLSGTAAASALTRRGRTRAERP